MNLYRTDGLLSLPAIRAQKIVVIGAGSVGSLVCENLAYPWKEIVVIDPENLAKENVERHLLGLSWVGKPKAHGVALWLTDRGVTNVTPVADHAEKVLKNHKDANLLLIVGGDQSLAQWVNRWNVYNIPVVTAGIYAKGREGEIVVLPEPSKVCLACAESIYPQPKETDTADNYGMEPEGVIPETTPALRYSISHLAAAVAKVVLQLAERQALGARLIRWTNSWSTVAVIPKGGGSIDESLEGWVNSLALLGASPNVYIERSGEERKIITRDTYFEFPIPRSNSCVYHE